MDKSTPETAFKDHFSAVAADYARFRPRYPEALFSFLATQPAARHRAWDCATGNGQAALGLAPHFAAVVATDASASQLASATPHPGIVYRQARAEQSGLDSGSVDLVTVAQAIHWLDRPRFYAEVRRVLAPGGVLAVWLYPRLGIGPPLDPILDDYYHEVVGPYWPPERRWIERGLAALPFPFAERPAPAFAMEVSWRLADLTGYLATWSASRRYREERGEDPVAVVAPRLAEAWGDPERERRIRWPLDLRLGGL